MNRRLSRRSLLAASLLAPLVPGRAAGQGTPDGAAVPMYHGNPARDGVHPGPGPAGEPALRWQAQLGKIISTTPAVVGDLVYIGSVSPGTPQGGALHAIDAATGIERWRLATAPGDAIFSSPAVVDGIAVAGSYDGIVVAADAASGSERWRFQAGQSIYGSPAIADGTVYIGDIGGHFYALDAASGQERWRVVEGDGDVRSFGSAALMDATLFCVGLSRREWEDTWLHAWDAASGQERWRFRPEAGNTLSGVPVAVDDTVYVATIEPLVYAVDAATGEERARFDLGAISSTDLAVADGVVFAGTETGALHAIETGSGATRWTLQLTQGVGLIASPTVADGRVYANDAAGILHAVDIATGTAAWAIEVGSLRSSPAIIGGAVYIGGNNGALVAIGGSDQAS